MSCEAWRPLLTQAAENRLDGLNATDQKSLTVHLAQCPECRDALDDQRAVREALSTRGDAPVPAGFAGRVASVVSVGAASTSAVDVAPAWVEMLRWRTWSYRLAPLAAGLLLFGVVTARSASESGESVGLSDLAESWAFGAQDMDARPAFTVWGQGDVGGDALLDAVLSAEPDEPLTEGDAS